MGCLKLTYWPQITVHRTSKPKHSGELFFMQVFDRADLLGDLDPSYSPMSYVNGDPINNIDLFGLSSQSAQGDDPCPTCPGKVPGAPEQTKQAETQAPYNTTAVYQFQQILTGGRDLNYSGQQSGFNSPNVNYAQKVALPNQAHQNFKDSHGNYQKLATGAIESDYTIEAALIPFWKGAGLGLSFLKGKIFGKALAKGGMNVYTSTANGVTQYVGITNNFARRAAEHLSSKGINIQPLMKGLTTGDARAVEQALIEIHGLGKNGGTLLNKINSISTKNPTYGTQLNRGYELLKSIGY